ncbi:uncharacterized protein LOC129909607 [Episyrphus balteatus]|uniref:uncharacterized protein LOC129909607 n=1 Tax=Episyrphus balteatus TaxID=286459 RepID=UPI002484E42E|nr:uncharacterized protein LOC129909607 [Episyrphus balteatus]
MITRSPPPTSSATGQKSLPKLPERAKEDSEKKDNFEKDNNDLRQRLDETLKLYQELKEEINFLRIKNEALKKAHQEIDLLRKENDMLKIAQTLKETKTTPQQVVIPEYKTDKEELERETERSSKNSKRRTKKHTNIKEKPVKIRPPPPINVVGVAEFNKLQTILKALPPTNLKVISLNNNKWKVCVKDSDNYRLLSRRLNEEKVEWYTYENKSESPLRVVVRGLHSSCQKTDIINDLKEKNYKILDAENIVKKERQQKDKETVVNTCLVVKIEPQKKHTKQVPQCRRCQGFNHTQTYCKKEPRCVKCAEKHLTADCTGNSKSPAKCINCNGSHPASYRGCEVAKELQKRREKIHAQRKPTKNETSKTPKRVNTTKPATGKENQTPTTSNTSPKKLSESLVKVEMPPRLTNGKTNWEDFKKDIEDNVELRVSLQTPLELEKAVDNFVHVVQKAAWNNTPCQREISGYKDAKYPQEIKDVLK